MGTRNFLAALDSSMLPLAWYNLGGHQGRWKLDRHRRRWFPNGHIHFTMSNDSSVYNFSYNYWHRFHSISPSIRSTYIFRLFSYRCQSSL